MLISPVILVVKLAPMLNPFSSHLNCSRDSIFSVFACLNFEKLIKVSFLQSENEVKEELAEVDGVTVFPNPATAYFKVKLNNFKADEAIVSCIDPLGREVFQQKINVNNGGFEQKFSTENLSEGLYTILINWENIKSFTKKVLIKK